MKLNTIMRHSPFVTSPKSTQFLFEQVSKIFLIGKRWNFYKFIQLIALYLLPLLASTTRKLD